jgi:hypothetical protein
MLAGSNLGMCPGCGVPSLPGVLQVADAGPAAPDARRRRRGARPCRPRRGYEVDVPALVERLRGLTAVQLLAVVDVAERMNAAVLRGDFEGRERARREFGVGG